MYSTMYVCTAKTIQKSFEEGRSLMRPAASIAAGLDPPFVGAHAHGKSKEASRYPTTPSSAPSVDSIVRDSCRAVASCRWRSFGYRMSRDGRLLSSSAAATCRRRNWCRSSTTTRRRSRINSKIINPSLCLTAAQPILPTPFLKKSRLHLWLHSFFLQADRPAFKFLSLSYSRSLPYPTRRRFHHRLHDRHLSCSFRTRLL